MKWTTILTEQLDKLKADAARARRERDKWEAIAEKYMELFFKARAAVLSPAEAAVPPPTESPLCGFSGCCLAAKWRITWSSRTHWCRIPCETCGRDTNHVRIHGEWRCTACWDPKPLHTPHKRRKHARSKG